MLAEVTGRVSALRLDAAVVVVGGLGLLVRATPGTLAGLRVGEQARLATSLVVREDSLTLYGFADDDEREAFEVLQTVSGVGPRLAMAMLAVHTPEALRRAVATQDLTALTRVPGIGRKGAQRIALELGDRLGPPSALPAEASSGDAELLTGPRRAPSGVVGPPSGGVGAQVVEALVGLGWSSRQAEEATAAALAAATEQTDGAAGRQGSPEDHPAAGAVGGSVGAGNDDIGGGSGPGAAAGTGGRPDAAGVLRAALRSLARS